MESNAQPPTTPLQLWRLEEGAPPVSDTDVTVTEEPLEIRVEGRVIAVIMRTPGRDRELAAGFLLGEGVIASPADIFEISLCPTSGGSVVDVMLRDPGSVDFARLSRHILTPGSCGICGKTSIADALARHPSLTVDNSCQISREVLYSLPERLRSVQADFTSTGGSHAAACFTTDGSLLACHEDAGRHNAVDKVNGQALLQGLLPLANGILMLSGRVSFELVQKALAAGIPVIAAIGAPSSLAVSTAEAAGITLCGFLRSHRVNVYTHPCRIAGWSA